MSAKLTTEEFIVKSKKIHGSSFDYSKTVYVKAHGKVEIKCNTCNSIFYMTPTNHTHRTKPQGCPSCGSDRRLQHIKTCAAQHLKGKSCIKPLEPKDYKTNILQDLGMRPLKGRNIRYVELECTECSKGFEVSCDNAKKRGEHICPSCKKEGIKEVCVCKVCHKIHKHFKSFLKGNPNTRNICSTCSNKENHIRTKIQTEGLTISNIISYLYIDAGIIYKKLTKEPIDVDQHRPRIYGVRVFYSTIAYALYHKVIDNSAGRLDEKLPYIKENVVKGINYGGFKTNKPGILYYLKVNNGEAYKIGITNHSVDKRFSLDDLEKIQIVKTWHFTDGKECMEKEKEIKIMYKDFKYIGPDILKSGNTELFTQDILGEDT